MGEGRRVEIVDEIRVESTADEDAIWEVAHQSVIHGISPCSCR